MSLACVLVINCGSSSMKFSVIPQDADQPLLSGLAERLGIDHAVITFKDRDGHKSTVALDDASHQHALKVLFAKLDEQQLLEAINAVGHRVAHGGSDFKRSVLVTDDVIEKVRALSVLAPLHNPANLIGIEAARALLPALPHIAVFDTAFPRPCLRLLTPMRSRWSSSKIIWCDVTAFTEHLTAILPPRRLHH